MKIQKIWVASFSPTQTARKTASRLAQSLSKKLEAPIEFINFTNPNIRKKVFEFGPEDLFIAATCIYAGRVPNKIMPDWKTAFKGHNTPVIPAVVFGNRSFDDGLKELHLILEENGFTSAAAFAMTSQHAFARNIGVGRPNEDDYVQLEEFAIKVADKILSQPDGIPFESFYIKGNDPIGPYYKPLCEDGTSAAALIKAKPWTTDACDQCKICANICPVNAISLEDCTQTPGTCIKCQACVRFCPQQAKYFDDHYLQSHARYLEQNEQTPKENSFFL